MEEKGLHVTFVLNCCFSGNVTRNGGGDNTVRTTPCHHDTDGSYSLNTFDDAAAGQILRDVWVKTNWMLNPDGYAILAAAGPDEYAGEYEERDAPGVKYGGLTFMLDIALRQCGVRAKFDTLYRQLFLENFPKQNPVSFGNQFLSFFEKLTPLPDTSSICTFTRDDCIYLDAGYAHGMHIGDEYELRPPDLSECDEWKVRQAKVVAVDVLSSKLEEIGDTSSGVSVTTGWWAKPLILDSHYKIPVGLIVADEEQMIWSAISTKQLLFKFANGNQHGKSCPFYVRSNENAEYELLDIYKQHIELLAPVPRTAENARNLVVTMLVHLMAFKYFEGIENRNLNGRLPSLVNIKLVSKSGEPFNARTFKNTPEDDILTLHIGNLGEEDIYVSLFELSSSYEVKDLLQGDKFQTVAGKWTQQIAKIRNMKEPLSKITSEIRSSVPIEFKERGLFHCDDIIKVFITSRPSLFAQFQLPRITDPDWRHKFGDILDKSRKKRRDLVDAQTYNPLEGDWWTQNFCIHTVSQKAT
ncbi:MAG: hypothetical protein Q9225_002318 [Loekoesia sp. 1 TL-2023]